MLHTEGYTIKGVQRMLGQGGVNKLPQATETAVTAAPQAVTAKGFDLAQIVGELEELRDLLKKAVA